MIKKGVYFSFSLDSLGRKKDIIMVFGNRCGGSGSYIIIVAQLPVTTEFFFSHIIFAFFLPPLVNQKTKT